MSRRRTQACLHCVPETTAPQLGPACDWPCMQPCWQRLLLMQDMLALSLTGGQNMLCTARCTTATQWGMPCHTRCQPVSSPAAHLQRGHVTEVLLDLHIHGAVARPDGVHDLRQGGAAQG
jgi:hypothetical protein